jgi:CubicO group peptidase (beta-lactamase class C family)
MTPETVLQAASISKAVTAVGVLRLVGDEAVSLDEDVAEVVDWRGRVRGADAKVTLRQLLSHSAGTTVSGFPGYPYGAPLPETDALLLGKGNTPPIRLERVPGTGTKYSGGGFLVVQAVVEEAEDEPFSDVMHRAIFAPLGMARSTFQQPLAPERLRACATGYDANGRAVVGRARVYPERAAAGLWTTPTDLATLVTQLQASLQGRSSFLPQAAVAAMLRPTSADGKVGLGWFIEPTNGGVWARHNGRNAGFTSWAEWSTRGEGIVVMTNGEAHLGEGVARAVRQLYGWR